MKEPDGYIKRVRCHYDRLAVHGPYGTLAPHNRGGRKAQYVAAVFDTALSDKITSQVPLKCILDYGCGTGIFTQKMSKFAKKVVGVDISLGVLAQARTVCADMKNILLLNADGVHIPLCDRRVDLVVAREVLCYVPDEKLVPMLTELRRVTRPDGRFLWIEQVSKDPYWQHHPEAPNLVKRSPSTLHAAAAESGWQVNSEQIIRTPRFPWIYPVWFGWIPLNLIPTLARCEIAWHAHFGSWRTPSRWWNTLLELWNPNDE